MNPRLQMNKYLNRLWDIFTHVVHVPRDDDQIEQYLIEQYLMAMDEAKGLLSKLCTKSLAECSSCDGCD